VFTGATVGVVKNNHIQVDFFYRYMPRRMGRAASALVDLMRVAFFGATVVLTVMLMLKLGRTSRMTLIDLPMNWVYGVCLLGFAAMTLRSVQIAWIHHRRGYSVLERPTSEIGDR
jgi:TRAP-type C4-dicarboxylate transport system permease small subunit